MEKIRCLTVDIDTATRIWPENDKQFIAMFDLYMAGKYELKESTRTNYLYMYKKYVSDEIGQKKLAVIKYSHIKSFYNSLIQDKGFKPNSMEIINTILYPFFTLAVRDGYIRINPTDGVMTEIKKAIVGRNRTATL